METLGDLPCITRSCCWLSSFPVALRRHGFHLNCRLHNFAVGIRGIRIWLRAAPDGMSHFPKLAIFQVSYVYSLSLQRLHFTRDQSFFSGQSLEKCPTRRSKQRNREDRSWRNTSVAVAACCIRWIPRFGTIHGLVPLLPVESKLSSPECRSRPPNPQFRQA